MPCLHNAKLVLPDRVLDRGWVLVEGDLIMLLRKAFLQLGMSESTPGGGYLAPGFIDLHVHGGTEASDKNMRAAATVSRILREE